MHESIILDSHGGESHNITLLGDGDGSLNKLGYIPFLRFCRPCVVGGQGDVPLQGDFSAEHMIFNGRRSLRKGWGSGGWACGETDWFGV